MDKISCVLPFPPDINNHQAQIIHRELARALCQNYGGFSRYLGHGEWLDGDGKPISETHVRYEVTFDPLTHTSHSAKLAFEITGQALHQEVIHIEIWRNGEAHDARLK